MLHHRFCSVLDIIKSLWTHTHTYARCAVEEKEDMTLHIDFDFSDVSRQIDKWVSLATKTCVNPGVILS